MSGVHRVNGQQTGALAPSQYRNTSSVVDRCPLEQPLDLDGQVTRGHQAIHRNRILKVCWCLTEVKRRYFGRSCRENIGLVWWYKLKLNPKENYTDHAQFKDPSTVYNQLGRVLRRVCIVSCLAGVVAGVACVHRVYGQYARLLAPLDNGDARVGLYVCPIKQPCDVHGQIAQIDETINRNRLLKVDGMIAKVKVCNFRGNLGMWVGVQGSKLYKSKTENEG